jgi:hypothetical protein
MSSKEVARNRCNDERQKESGQEFLPASAASTAKMAEVALFARLLTGSGGSAGGLRIRLGNADVAANLILANLVHHYLFGYMCAGDVEENGLVKSAVLLFEALVFDSHGEIDLILLLVYALEFHSDVSDLLGLVLASDGEFDIVALAEAAELVDLIMVARDEGSHLALGHFQVFLGGVEVFANGCDLRVDVLYVIRAGLSGQFGVDGRVKSAELLSRLVILLRDQFGLLPSLLQLALGNLELVGDNLQVTLKIGIGLLVLCDAVLQGGHILLYRLFGSLELRGNVLLSGVKL